MASSERLEFGFQDPVGHASSSDPPKVLLSLPQSRELARTLRLCGAEVLEFDWFEPARPRNLDVAVIRAEGLNLNVAALLHDAAIGFPELVFAVDGRCPAQRLALLSRGYRHVIAEDRLPWWLPQQLKDLCNLARARRTLLAACSHEAHEADITLGRVGAGPTNLHNAENQFRETFLRALLAEHGSRRKAAEAAGVPYRSFCEMLRKLRI